MTAIINPLIAPGEFLVAEVQQRDCRRSTIDMLFDGSVDECADRWGGSAVLDNAGCWHVVLTTNHVQPVDGVNVVRLYSGGSFQGSGTLRGPEWFRLNAVKLFLGALGVQTGRGTRALRVVDGDNLCVEVLPRSMASTTGRWTVELVRDGVPEESRMYEALMESLADVINVTPLFVEEPPSEDPTVRLAEVGFATVKAFRDFRFQTRVQLSRRRRICCESGLHSRVRLAHLMAATGAVEIADATSDDADKPTSDMEEVRRRLMSAKDKRQTQKPAAEEASRS